MTITPTQAQQGSPWPALWALVIGFFMILVDATIVSVATPTLMATFDADVSEVLWVTSAYLLAYAVPLLVTGRLGDRVGPRRMYLIGLSVFTLASLWCGLAEVLHGDIAGLIAARVVQGLGASMMTPQTMAVITRTFPPYRRGLAMSLWGATAGIATLVGPLLGGLLVDTLGWEWIFFVNVPVGVVGLVLAARWVPRLPTHARRVDLPGVALSAAGLSCLVLGIQESQAQRGGALTAVPAPVLVVVGMAFLAALVWWQSRPTNPDPLMPLSLFRDRNFALATLAISSVGFTVTALTFPLMIWAQDARGLPAATAALLLAPSSVMSLLLAPVGGWLADRVHPRLLVCSGSLLLGLSLGWQALSMTADGPWWPIVAASVLIGVANPLLWGPLATTATANLPVPVAGAGSGVYNTTRQLGAVLGSAGVAALMNARMTSALGDGGGVEGTMVGGPLSAGAAEPLSNALAGSMLLPAFVILVATLAALGFRRPAHIPARRVDQGV